MVFASVPGIFTLCVSWFVLPESPRFLATSPPGKKLVLSCHKQTGTSLILETIYMYTIGETATLVLLRKVAHINKKCFPSSVELISQHQPSIGRFTIFKNSVKTLVLPPMLRPFALLSALFFLMAVLYYCLVING